MACKNFFSSNVPLRDFFLYFARPPHEFSNGLSLRRVRSICLLGVQVAVEGKGGMVLPIDNYMIMAYFERVAYSETSI